MSVLTITKDNFQSEVMESDKPVLIDFWATWCGPCQMMSPIVDEVADETEDVKIGKVNVDEEVQLAAMFGIESIPTLVVIKNGKTVNTSVGLCTKEEVLEMINV
ncbi:MAG: thioredoxin [Clostridiales bacterium]|nr:thioredoxin [Clostridiales bacterium]